MIVDYYCDTVVADIVRVGRGERPEVKDGAEGRRKVGRKEGGIKIPVEVTNPEGSVPEEVVESVVCQLQAR